MPFTLINSSPQWLARCRLSPVSPRTSLIIVSFEDSKVRQIYHEKGQGKKIIRKKETHLIFSHIWVFSGPGGFDVEMVKQLLKEEVCVINIQLLCNSHSSLKGTRACSSLEVTVGKCRHYLMAELWKSSLEPGKLRLHPSCSLNLPRETMAPPHLVCFPSTLCSWLLHGHSEISASRWLLVPRDGVLSLLCIRCGPSGCLWSTLTQRLGHPTELWCSRWGDWGWGILNM